MSMITLSKTAQSFAADLALLPCWGGPKKLKHFSTNDWQNFAKYVANDDGTLSKEDQELCEEIASSISSQLNR